MKQFVTPFPKLFGRDCLNRVDLFCLGEAPDYVQLECGSELGGIVAIGLIHPDEEVDEDSIATNLEEATWWTTGQDASPQTHWLVLDTRGSLAAGTPTEEEGFGLIPTERTGDDRELLFESLGLMDNRDFVATVNKRRNWKLVYVTAGYDSTNDGYQSFYVKNVSLYGSDMIEQSIKTRKRWSWSAKWSTDMTPGLPFIFPASLLP